MPDRFAAEVLDAAEDAVASPALPEADSTGIPFITIDPKGSRDLDQALHIERRGSGYRVRYAIADVGAFVRAGCAVDVEAHRRGQTLYSPDGRTPLYPPVLGEGAASLLAGEERPSVLWTLDLDSSAEPISVDVRRALIRSREQLAYEDALDREDLALLAEVGRRRREREIERGGASLTLADQEVAILPGGRPALLYRTPLAVEAWNAQISLLTGMAAAQLMIEAGVGVLRTLPPPEEEDVSTLRRTARGLGVDWPGGLPYAAFVRTLDPHEPEAAALLNAAVTLFRGAGYTAFDGVVPEHSVHSGVAAPYAHATAPLRRMADRYVSETCLAISAGLDVPEWVRLALPALAEEMEDADRRAGSLERATLDLVEAMVLADRVGEVFDAVVVTAAERGGNVQIHDPAVRAWCRGDDLALGEPVHVRLVRADPEERRVEFELV